MTNMPHDLTLESRPGLPDELAYLRAAYPKEEWREHRNFGGLSAFWLQIHASLRDEGRHLSELTTAFREGRLDAGAFQRSFLPRLNRFLQHLDGHHRIEDDFYFPKFRELDQRLVAGFDLLEADHEHIHEALLASASSGSALLTSLGHGPDATRGAADTHGTDIERLLKLLVRHLADEEDLIVPAMLHHGERPVA
jgi:iron-sulfur cluster repair protein YtfE (RIC family)